MNPAVNYAKEGFKHILSVNFIGASLATKHASRRFVRNGIKGSIVAVASMSVQIAN
jgi:NAD(P)-dependent dehydrogenase (short-subunit alcohol dehydrogenase family)